MSSLSLALVCAVTALVSSPQAPTNAVADDAGSHEWNQPRGGAACDATCDVAPVRSQPKELWRYKGGDRLIGEPVAWANVLYTLVKRGRETQLVAIDLANGKQIASSIALEVDEERAFVACWNGAVAVVTTPAIRFFTFRGGRFYPITETGAGTWVSPPTVHDFMLLVCERSRGLHVFDMRTGKQLASTAVGLGQPGVLVETPQRWKVGTLVFAEGTTKEFGDVKAVAVSVVRMSITPDGVVLAPTAATGHSPLFERDATEADIRDGFAAPLEAAGEMKAPTWIFWTPERLLVKTTTAAHIGILPVNIAPIVRAPVLHSGWGVGFSELGEALRFRGDGKFQIIANPESKELRRGRTTAARDVLYFENWAVEAESGQILWSDEKLQPQSALLPVANGKLVYVADKSTLVCLGESDPALAAKATSKSKAGAANASPRPSRVGSGDGIVLADGRRLAGRATKLADGRIELASASGAAGAAGGSKDAKSVHDASSVALVELDGAVELLGEPFAVYRAAWAAERADALDDLEKAYEDFLARNLLGECARIVGDLRALDVDEARRDKLARKLAGRKELEGHAVDKQRELGREFEARLRDKRCKSIVATAAWMSAHGMPLAASALLARAESLAPGRNDVGAAALALVPAGFTYADAKRRPLEWLKLADAIAPVSGEVVPPDDPAARVQRKAPWDAGVLLLRTKNVLLLSREPDPAIVGECLRHAERTVRVLERELGSVARSSGGDAPLEVRVHANREQYLEDQSAGGAPPEWTAGFYSALDGVSRFYVPRETEQRGDPLERALFEVLAHELTHQWISARWLGQPGKPATGAPRSPGFWIVEGFARFVEDQIVGAGEALSIDDERANSIDVSARIHAQQQLMPLDQMLDLDQLGFWELSKEPLTVVQPQRLLRRAEINATSRFYEQGGALAYLLMHHENPAIRKQLVEYLRAWYTGELPKESWKRLGYDDVAQLEREFRAFLERH